jgi:hypothetical protein
VWLYSSRHTSLLDLTAFRGGLAINVGEQTDSLGFVNYQVVATRIGALWPIQLPVQEKFTPADAAEVNVNEAPDVCPTPTGDGVLAVAVQT